MFPCNRSVTSLLIKQFDDDGRRRRKKRRTLKFRYEIASDSSLNLDRDSFHLSVVKDDILWIFDDSLIGLINFLLFAILSNSFLPYAFLIIKLVS